MQKISLTLIILFFICCKQPSSTKPKLSSKDSLIIEHFAAIDSCIRLKKISELNADEVFRFSHGQAFCFYKQIVTIGKNGDSIFLHYLEYSGTDNGNLIEYRDKAGLQRFGPGCRIEKEFYKRLIKKDWDDLEKNAETANYWKLEEKDNRVIRDGSSWQVDAYTNNQEYKNSQVYSVQRNSTNEKPFSLLCLLFMKLAGEKGMCEQFN